MSLSRISRCFAFFLLSTLLSPLSNAVGAAEIEGKRSDFHGFTRIDFQHNGRGCILVTPDQAASGNPWVWRARFFGHEPQLDVALLQQGYHIAYVDVAGLFGAPKAVDIWDDFYSFLVDKHAFHSKPVIEAMSRGGLIAYNWAKQNPNSVQCIYADAPVCVISSWPGGKGKGTGSPGAWKQCLDAYGFTESEGIASKLNPIDGLAPLVTAGVPLIHVVGDDDQVVPVEENTAILEQRYKALGGTIKVIHKPGIGHHPHSLKDPTPILQFIRESNR